MRELSGSGGQLGEGELPVTHHDGNAVRRPIGFFLEKVMNTFIFRILRRGGVELYEEPSAFDLAQYVQFRHKRIRGLCRVLHQSLELLRQALDIRAAKELRIVLELR